MSEAASAGYFLPRTVAEAVSLLVRHPGARLIAGGTDLMVAMRDGHLRPAALVDLTRVQALREIREDSHGLHIGAATRITDVLESPAVRGRLPVLTDAGRLLGGWQIQNMATLGGNLCNASPAAEMAPPLLVLDAEVEAEGPGGRRRFPVRELWTGPGRTCLEPAEILTCIVIPRPREGGKSAYQRVHIRHSVDIALASGAARLTLRSGGVESVRLALGAVAPTPILVEGVEELLRSHHLPLSAEVLERAAELAQTAARPISDVRASADYRRAMAGVLARRVLEAAAARP